MIIINFAEYEETDLNKLMFIKIYYKKMLNVTIKLKGLENNISLLNKKCLVNLGLYE